MSHIKEKQYVYAKTLNFILKMFVITVILFLLSVHNISLTFAEFFFVKELPVSNNQINDLAQAVCDEMLVSLFFKLFENKYLL